MTPEERIQHLEDRLNAIDKSDRFVFQKNFQIFNGRNFQLGISVGTKIGTAATQKLSVFGVTPVVQAGAISSPSGGATIDTAARTAIDAIRTALKNFGITA